MKILNLVVLGGVAVSGCAMLQFGAFDPMISLTCKGVNGALEMKTSQAKAFIQDLKNGNKAGEVCLKNAKFCSKAIELASQDKLDCDLNPVTIK